jgi:hypothetical protein
MRKADEVYLLLHIAAIIFGSYHYLDVKGDVLALVPVILPFVANSIRYNWVVVPHKSIFIWASILLACLLSGYYWYISRFATPQIGTTFLVSVFFSILACEP